MFGATQFSTFSTVSAQSGHWRKRRRQLSAITRSQLIDHFVGAFFPDKASRLYEQKASAVLVV
jgi:hypothetical protein